MNTQILTGPLNDIRHSIDDYISEGWTLMSLEKRSTCKSGEGGYATFYNEYECLLVKHPPKEEE